MISPTQPYTQLYTGTRAVLHTLYTWGHEQSYTHYTHQDTSSLTLCVWSTNIWEQTNPLSLFSCSQLTSHIPWEAQVWMVLSTIPDHSSLQKDQVQAYPLPPRVLSSWSEPRLCSFQCRSNLLRSSTDQVFVEGWGCRSGWAGQCWQCLLLHTTCALYTPFLVTLVQCKSTASAARVVLHLTLALFTVQSAKRTSCLWDH